MTQRKKNGSATWQQSKDALKGLDTMCVKNCDPLLYHQAVKIASAQVPSPPDKSSILAHFWFQKPWFFFHFSELVSHFSHELLIKSLIYKFYLIPYIFNYTCHFYNPI
jgi:hypothetical protein